MSKRWGWVAVLPVCILVAGGLARGQSGTGDAPMDTRSMGSRPGMGGPDGMMGMGSGMMGMGGMGCPMMMPGVDVSVQKLPNGASINVTSSDPKVASRIQKRAEIVRLMHELQKEEQ